MTNASSSSARRSKATASSADGTSTIPGIQADQTYSGLSDVTAAVNVAAMPTIPELDTPAQGSTETSGQRTYAQPYVNPLMPVLRRLRRQAPEDITDAEMDALMSFIGDVTGNVRVNSIFLGEAVSFMACELYQRYSQTALTVAIYLGKHCGMGTPNVKREISRATGVTIGESDGLTGFPRHLGLRYTTEQLTDAITYLNEAYGENGTVKPGAITSANEVLKLKNEAAGRPNR